MRQEQDQKSLVSQILRRERNSGRHGQVYCHHSHPEVRTENCPLDLQNGVSIAWKIAFCGPGDGGKARACMQWTKNK